MPDTPMSKAQGLLARVLKDANNCRQLVSQLVIPGSCQNTEVVHRIHKKYSSAAIFFQGRCSYDTAKDYTSALQSYLRDHAFKLRPLSLSSDLIDQLKACAVKLGHQADALQSLISKGKNKNKHYASLIAEVMGFEKMLYLRDGVSWSWNFQNLFNVFCS